jgi:UDP-2,3-diacylglucosamine hydrolase
MAERLALIAGSGALVPEVIAAAQKKGFELKLLTLGRRSELHGYRPAHFSLSDPQAAVKVIRDFGATRFAMAGGVSLSDVVREGLASFFSGTTTRQSIGDTSISDLVRRLEDMTGARPIGVHEIAPELLAPRGLIGGPEPDDLVRQTAADALDLARRAGALDLGQALVVAGKRAIAAEDVGGTDALLRRVRWLRWKGLVAGGKASPLVLAKAPKPDQPLFIDLPAIGPRTMENARKSGICAVTVQAGGTLLIQRERLREAANRLGITVIGLPIDG